MDSPGRVETKFFAGAPTAKELLSGSGGELEGVVAVPGGYAASYRLPPAGGGVVLERVKAATTRYLAARGSAPACVVVSPDDFESLTHHLDALSPLSEPPPRPRVRRLPATPLDALKVRYLPAALLERCGVEWRYEVVPVRRPVREVRVRGVPVLCAAGMPPGAVAVPE